jgi:hypothetical protein
LIDRDTAPGAGQEDLLRLDSATLIIPGPTLSMRLQPLGILRSALLARNTGTLLTSAQTEVATALPMVDVHQ